MLPADIDEWIDFIDNEYNEDDHGELAEIAVFCPGFPETFCPLPNIFKPEYIGDELIRLVRCRRRRTNDSDEEEVIP